MEERTITISLDEYKELVEKAERIAAVERFLESASYPSLSDVEPILGIAKESENEAV
ncbi:MAG: hypothetical protein IKB02_05285 [Clostridia bacterium]|nr:hypothetical protein [Clostridia bacterium]